MFNRHGIIAILVLGSVCFVNGQEHKRITNSVVEPLYMAPQADRVDLRLAHKALVREDTQMKAGSELRQGGQAVTTVAKPKTQGLDALGTRQERANLRLQQDRAKVRREAAVDDSDSD